MLAIIGGSGLTQLANLEIACREWIATPYGEPSAAVTRGRMRGHEVLFLARHGDTHTFAPHEVNYRANVWALHSLGAKDVVAVNTVGGIDARLGPGALVVPDQIIDYTHGRKQTYFEGAGQPVTHVDFTHPFCQALRARLLQAVRAAGESALAGGVYAAVQGPRLESKAEIDRLERDGATMVGMTGMPEAGLARELGLCYAMMGVSANHAAGRGDSRQAIDLEQIMRVVEGAMQRVRRILEKLLDGD